MKIITLIENTPGNHACHYEHGLSIYIETAQHKLLFDTGASDQFLQNAQLLDIDVTQIDTLILSHGHYDHSGGIMGFTQWNTHAKIYMQSSAGADYYHISPNDHRYIGIDKRILSLPQCVFVNGDFRIDSELFLFSHNTGGSHLFHSNSVLKEKVGTTYVPDTFRHEQYLVITQDDRHILISGCAHNGILNILEQYAELFHRFPDIVISGFHMRQKEPYSSDDIAAIRHIASALLATGSVFYTGHCTGQEAYDLMSSLMGDKLKPLHSGETLFSIET